MGRIAAPQTAAARSRMSQVDGDTRDVPPSTISALVQHQTRAQQPSLRSGAESSLVVELLEDVRQNPGEHITDNLEENADLLRALPQMFLASPQVTDPFEARAKAVDHALACLDVLELAISRTPKVLFQDSSNGTGASAALCLSFFPGLFAALDDWDNESVQDGLTRVFTACLQALTGSFKMRKLLLKLRQFYEQCVEDLVAALEGTSKCSDNTTMPEMVLPCAQACMAIRGEGQQPVFVANTDQIRIRSRPHAALIASVMLTAISKVLSLSLVCPVKDPGISVQTSTTIETVARLSRSISNSRSRLDRRQCLRVLPVHLTLTATALDLAHTPSAPVGLPQLMVDVSVALMKECFAVEEVDLTDTLQSRFLRLLTKLRDSEDFHLRAAAKRTISWNAGTFLASHKKIDGELRNALLTANSAGAETVPTAASSVNGQHADTPRSSKRRKRDDVNHDQSASPNASRDVDLQTFCSLMGNWDRSDLVGLAKVASDIFSDIGEEGQIEVLQIFSRLSSVQRKDWSRGQFKAFFDIAAALLQARDVQQSKTLRVLMANAVRQLVRTTDASDHLDLTKSPIGKWCLQSLRSSVRQLRIHAASTIGNFISEGLDSEIRMRNRVIVLDVLRQLVDLNDQRFGESLIISLGQVCRACEGDERAIALNFLAEYLGHSSKFLCDMAYLEVKQLASDLGAKSVSQFLSPFWRVVGVSAIKDFITRPQKVQQLADLVGVRVDQFLWNTQPDVLPWLIVEKKQDVLEKLAKARGGDATVWDMCMHRRSLPFILAAIVAQHPKEIEAAVASCLRIANDRFRIDDTVNLLKTEPITIACELLKTAGDKNSIDREKAIDGFKEFTVLVEKRGQQTKTASTQARMSTLFYENHALGMMNVFSSTIDSDLEPPFSKRRSVVAIEQLIAAGSSNIVVTLPQIRSCLQSALHVDHLKESAFIAILALAPALKHEEEHIEWLIELTFAAVVQNWNYISSPTQQLAYDTVSSLIKDHGDLVHQIIPTIPSFASIPMMAKFESQLGRIRDKLDVGDRLNAFRCRCESESNEVTLQALRELVVFLETHQRWVHESCVTEPAHPAIPELMRSLLDISVKSGQDDEVLDLIARCLGIIGCVDPNRVETVREKYDMVLLSNFGEQLETIEWVAYLLEEVLVKAFHSATNPRAQGFLAYVMQELLKFCGFNREAASPFRPQGSQHDDIYQKWQLMTDSTRSTLTPFLSSHYVLTTQPSKATSIQTYPIFKDGMSHGTWLRTFVLDLLQRPKGDNAKQIFGVLSRVIRGYDSSIAASLLPFLVTNVALGGIKDESEAIAKELHQVLSSSATTGSQAHDEAVRLASESVFHVLDYLGRFSQEKKRALGAARTMAVRSARPMPEVDEQTYLAQITGIERLLASAPAQVISRRAVECGSFARALYHWEQHMRLAKKEALRPRADTFDQEAYYQRLQDIYSQIDEPDGIDGISAFLHVLKPEQQVLEHRRAGRWAAAQCWYELRLREEPEDLDLNVSLLECLKNSGQHGLLLDFANGLTDDLRHDTRVMSLTCEAAWTTRDVDALVAEVAAVDAYSDERDFNIRIATAMSALQQDDYEAFNTTVKDMRLAVVKSLTNSATASLQTCHDQLLKLHALYDLQTTTNETESRRPSDMSISKLMDHRLNIVGSYHSDKQYLLAMRRAAMAITTNYFSDEELASTWLMSGKLARKEKWSNIAYEAALHAGELGDQSSKVEQAKLLWNEGEHNKAIQSLETAIKMNAFSGTATGGTSTSTSFSTATGATAATAKDGKQPDQNLLLAKAHLLVAKWLDASGQTQSGVINLRYQQAARSFTRWEKGLYHLGRFYNKLLESEKALPISKQNYPFLGGETAKLVIENFLRSLMFGCKYIFESVPKLLTLWLDFGTNINQAISKEVPDDVRAKATENRTRMLDTMNKQIKKYVEKLPAYLFYTALPQMITRMGHPNKEVYQLLANIIVKVVAAHSQQGLWPLLAVVKSTETGRATRANDVLGKLMEKGKNIRSEGQNVDLKSLVNQGQKLANQLLHACEVTIGGRSSTISLTKDMGFNSKVAPCALVVPVDSTLSASLPNTTMDHAQVKSHKAFPASREAVTISAFQDDVLVLNSLQRPRKLTVRGSDGKRYGLLCKPNDDLRKDQRLMEFNAMINRALKKDAESSKRRLYIKTYAVTPLNEACGLIEWVDGLKPMRDILLNSYRARGTKVDYNLLRELLNEACSGPDGHLIFSDTIVPMYEPVLHEWFTENFPDPDAWFAARLRYARSAAVTSMQGHALGLGDRHGENVLLEENSGGVFHVDFNCLFEKGLTFDKPELVPFRLTHNMVDAFGAYGVEGPFRRSAECTMRVMRASEDALLTILETFVYDPTADFVGTRKRPIKGVPSTPKEVLESVQSKLRGFLRGESVPLSVEGHVDALIKQATDPKNLCAMYIGWCAFL